jgi:putative glutamine amidotransferase
MTPPLVALTATTKPMDGIARIRLNEAYANAARDAGLTPIVVPPLEAAELGPILDAVDGVILTGGEDIDAGAYGAVRSPSSHEPHRQRDACELAIARLARERSLPTLAICRGIQLVNVALGGTLVQDIHSERPSGINHDQSGAREERLHAISITPGSLLADAVGATDISVNSSHHQSVDRVATGLRVTARAPDGIVEGVEWAGNDWWMLGVQWHPEELIGDSKSWDRGLFRAFADQARSHHASFQRASSVT